MKPLVLALLSLFPACGAANAYGRAEMAGYNALYKNGDYQAALDGYEKMAAENPEDPYAFYNAGNAYFRLNDPGRALLNYGRAFRLRPRGTDIRANLDFVMKRTGQTFVPEGVPKALHYAYYFLSDHELQAAAGIFWWSACLLLSLSFLRPALKERLRGLTGGAGFLLALSLLWLAARISGPFNGSAVVTARGSTPLMSGPGDSFKTYADLPEARLVKILDDTDDAYYEVGIPREGIKGWISKTAAEKL